MLLSEYIKKLQETLENNGDRELLIPDQNSWAHVRRIKSDGPIVRGIKAVDNPGCNSMIRCDSFDRFFVEFQSELRKQKRKSVWVLEN